MEKHRLTLLIGLYLLFFASCSKDELFPDFIYEMTVSTEAINVVPEGTDETVKVKSNSAWTAESNAAVRKALLLFRLRWKKIIILKNV